MLTLNTFQPTKPINKLIKPRKVKKNNDLYLRAYYIALQTVTRKDAIIFNITGPIQIVWTIIKTYNCSTITKNTMAWFLLKYE